MLRALTTLIGLQTKQFDVLTRAMSSKQVIRVCRRKVVSRESQRCQALKLNTWLYVRQQKAKFIKNFLYECLGKCFSISLYNDSQLAQKLCNSHIRHSRSKYIDIRYRFVRQVIRVKIVNLNYLSIEHMPGHVHFNETSALFNNSTTTVVAASYLVV